MRGSVQKALQKAFDFCSLIGEVMASPALLAKKVVCITGASRGIGRGCAVECAKHGATGLILHYFGDEATTKEIQSLKEEIESLHTHSKVVAVPGDIAQRETSHKVQTMVIISAQGGLTVIRRSWRRESRRSTE